MYDWLDLHLCRLETLNNNTTTTKTGQLQLIPGIISTCACIACVYIICMCQTTPSQLHALTAAQNAHVRSGRKDNFLLSVGGVRMIKVLDRKDTPDSGSSLHADKEPNSSATLFISSIFC